MCNKFNKKKLLKIAQIKKSPLLTLISKGDTEEINIEKFHDINGMEITFNVINQKN